VVARTGPRAARAALLTAIRPRRRAPRRRRSPPPRRRRPPSAVKLNANRHVTGVLRGFDQFMNLVLEGAVDERAGGAELGMVVLRGNSIATIEALERPDE
jgi:small nuclear ribonucleoprotein G